jgi:hypothetical protein
MAISELSQESDEGQLSPREVRQFRRWRAKEEKDDPIDEGEFSSNLGRVWTSITRSQQDMSTVYSPDYDLVGFSGNRATTSSENRC